MVVHVVPSTQKAEQNCEFQAILAYLMRPCLQQQQL